MKKKNWIIVLGVSLLAVVLLAGCFPTDLVTGIQDDPRSFSKHSEFEGYLYKDETSEIVLPYRFYKPDTENEAPLVILLHGSGERGNNNKAQLSYSFMGALLEVESLKESYIFVPQCPKKERWSDEKIADTLMRLIDLLMEDNSVDTSRIYITGLSMGGFGTIDQLYKTPDRFAAAMILCAGGAQQDYSPIAHIPMKIVHGDKDNTVDVLQSKVFYAGLEALSAPAELIIMEGVWHNVWDPYYKQKSAWDWLFAQQLG